MVGNNCQISKCEIYNAELFKLHSNMEVHIYDMVYDSTLCPFMVTSKKLKQRLRISYFWTPVIQRLKA